MHHYLTVEISPKAVAHNLQVLRSQIPAGCKLCAVVKADCYGHGLGILLDTIAAEADCLAVATLDEALEVRSRGYSGDVLMLMAVAAHAGGTLQAIAAEAIANRVAVSVTSLADVPVLQRLAEKYTTTAEVHVKVDTGMGRSGVVPSEATELIEAIRSTNGLSLCGVFTHFAASDAENKTHAEAQFATFAQVLSRAGQMEGVLRHAANSAAIADMPYAALDMVRPGIAVYGYQPSDDIRHVLPLQPSLRLTSSIIQVKHLPAGGTCGYGCTYKLIRDTRIGIVAGGYNDGVPRSLSGHCPVGLPKGVVPVLGRISMDQLIIDLTDHLSVGPGETVELISSDPQAPHCVQNLARLAGTIPYEITCGLGKRARYKAVDTLKSYA